MGSLKKVLHSLDWLRVLRQKPAISLHDVEGMRMLHRCRIHCCVTVERLHVPSHHEKV